METEQEPKTFYRYRDECRMSVSISVDGNESYHRHGPYLVLNEFPVLKKTEKGTWIQDLFVRNNQRFILDSSVKKYAHPTKVKALKGFCERKRRQIRILSTQLSDAEKSLQRATLLLQKENTI